MKAQKLQKETKGAKKNRLGVQSHHIDIEVRGFTGEPTAERAEDISRVVRRETDKWHRNGKFQTITCVSERSYRTEGEFTHRLEAWRPVQRELPDEDMTVLVAMADGEVWTGFLDEGVWRYVSGDLIEGQVTHWAEFPEPPKGCGA